MPLLMSIAVTGRGWFRSGVATCFVFITLSDTQLIDNSFKKGVCYLRSDITLKWGCEGLTVKKLFALVSNRPHHKADLCAPQLSEAASLRSAGTAAVVETV